MKYLFLFLSGMLAIPAFSQNSLSPQLYGPDGPTISATPSSGMITLTLGNLPTSNNFNEGYVEVSEDLVQQGQPDTTFNFQGYLVYQLAVCNFTQAPTWNFLQNPANARLVAQSDIVDNIDTLINHDPALSCAPETLVCGANTGIQHTIQLTTDAFTGLPFQGGSDYAFTAVAYGENRYYAFTGCTPLTSPFLQGGHLNQACVTMVGIREQTMLPPVAVAPNPAQTQLRVDLQSMTGAVQLVVFDLTGKMVLSVPVRGGGQETLNIASLPAGHYALYVIGDANGYAPFVKN